MTGNESSTDDQQQCGSNETVAQAALSHETHRDVHALPKHVHVTASSGKGSTPLAELSQLSNFDRVQVHNSSGAGGGSSSGQQHNQMPNEATRDVPALQSNVHVTDSDSSSSGLAGVLVANSTGHPRSGSGQQQQTALGATDCSNNADTVAWSWDDWHNPPPESSGGGSSSGGHGSRRQ